MLVVRLEGEAMFDGEWADAEDQVRDSSPFAQPYASLSSAIVLSYYLRRASILKVLWLWLRLQDAGALGHFTARRISPPAGEVCTAEISLVVEDAAFRGHRDAWEVRAPSRCLPSALCLLVPLALVAFCFLSTPSRGRI